jgi:hypothetical protein
MTPNIASPIFNTLLTMFFLVIAVGCATGAYAAIQLGKAQKRLEAESAQLAMATPYEPATTYDASATWDDPGTPDPSASEYTEDTPAPE